MVTAPVAAEIAILLPATNEVTPIFVTVIDPELVIGEPETEIPVPAVIPTEVTDPGPTAMNERFPPPSETNASPDPPSVVGKVYAVPPDPKVKLLVTFKVPVINELPKTSKVTVGAATNTPTLLFAPSTTNVSVSNVASS